MASKIPTEYPAPNSGECLVLVILCACVLQACSERRAGPQPIDTQYEITRQQAGSAFWADDVHFVFAGVPTIEMRAAVQAQERDLEAQHKKLYVWDASTGAGRLYADARFACYAAGEIKYLVRQQPGKAIFRKGPFGSEREIEETASELSEQDRREVVPSPFACEPTKRSALTPVPPHNQRIIALRAGDGYLDLGSSDLRDRVTNPNDLTLYQATTGRPIKLPVTQEEEVAVSYSAYRDAYVLRPSGPRGSPPGVPKPWPKGTPLLLYLLSRDGRVDEISVPYAPSEHLIEPQPVASGWIFGGGDFYKSSGLYFFDGKIVQKLDAGLVHMTAVSQDGCRAAVAIATNHLEARAPIRLKMFRFCGEK